MTKKWSDSKQRCLSHVFVDLLYRLCLAVCLCSVLVSCETKSEKHAWDNVKQLSTDIYLEIAGHTLTLPFSALDYFVRMDDSEYARREVRNLLHNATDPKLPLAFDAITVAIRAYGWNDDDISQRQMCPLLTREWARSVCDNPWAAIKQALPGDRFMLVDLSRLQVDGAYNPTHFDPHVPVMCFDNSKPNQPFPQRPGEGVMVCEKLVYGRDSSESHLAVVRIDGDLGAVWTVFHNSSNGETEEAELEREGKAIVAFVQHALGKRENFPILHDTLCQLRRPGSVDHPKGSECVNKEAF